MKNINMVSKKIKNCIDEQTTTNNINDKIRRFNTRKQKKTQKIKDGIKELSEVIKSEIKDQVKIIQELNESITEKKTQPGTEKSVSISVDVFGSRILEESNKMKYTSTTIFSLPHGLVAPKNDNMFIEGNTEKIVDHEANIKEQHENTIADPWICQSRGCKKPATHARLYYMPEYCMEHATRDCINVVDHARTCIFPNCIYSAEYNFNFTSYPLYCKYHTPNNNAIEIIGIEKMHPTRKIVNELEELRVTFNNTYDIANISNEHTQIIIQHASQDSDILNRLKRIARMKIKSNPNKAVSLFNIDILRYSLNSAQNVYDTSDEVSVFSENPKSETNSRRLPSVILPKHSLSPAFNIVQNLTKKTNQHTEPQPEPFDEEWYNSLFK